jgi:hypothetical protein
MDARSVLHTGATFPMSPLSLSSSEDISEEMIERLYLTQQGIFTEFVSRMTERERADAAIAFYGRVHLREIGLAIAAKCERETLIEAAGKVMGDILFTQARSGMAVTSEPWSRKPKITLASMASSVALDTRHPNSWEPDEADDPAEL